VSAWISVKERLPEETLAYVWGSDGKVVLLLSNQYYSWDQVLLEDYGVTHWQPVIAPEPPKEGDERA
jgi:hypothetical protein